MSNFTRSTINPASGRVEMAEWLDNHYGPNCYGVRFQDGTVYPEEVVKQPLQLCYQCGGGANWLAPDSRCIHCTRLTPEEIQGG